MQLSLSNLPTDPNLAAILLAALAPAANAGPIVPDAAPAGGGAPTAAGADPFAQVLSSFGGDAPGKPPAEPAAQAPAAIGVSLFESTLPGSIASARVASPIFSRPQAAAPIFDAKPETNAAAACADASSPTVGPSAGRIAARAADETPMQRETPTQKPRNDTAQPDFALASASWLLPANAITDLSSQPAESPEGVAEPTAMPASSRASVAAPSSSPLPGAPNADDVPEVASFSAPGLDESFTEPAVPTNEKELEIAPVCASAPAKPPPDVAGESSSAAPPVAIVGGAETTLAIRDESAAMSSARLAPVPQFTPTASEMFAEPPRMFLPPRANFGEVPPTADEENFAAMDGKFLRSKSASGIEREKTFLSAKPVRVTSREPGLGIDVAKSATAMPATMLSPRIPVVVLERAAAGVAGTSAAHDFSVATIAMPAEVVSTARRAVTAALDVAERFATREHHTVNLQFSVGGADLGVRVELRADEVRTTFRTDSAELRAALSHEWQAVTGGGSGDRAVRMAPPVFAASDPFSGGGFSGGGASRQRDQQQQPPARNDFEQLAGAGTGRARTFASSPSPAATAGDSSAAARLAQSTSLHLHTLA